MAFGWGRFRRGRAGARTGWVWVAGGALSAACGGGEVPLGYRLPAEPSVSYAYSDTTVVSLTVMGQAMEIGMRGAATYAVVFEPAPAGVEVALTVDRLAAEVSMPLATPERVDESSIDGALRFRLDDRGRATVLATPEVSMEAARMLSSLTTAHTFFPRLPARVVTAGDRWTDTVSYEGDAELGATTERSVLEYRVVGDTAIAGRSLLRIDLTGTTELTNAMTMGGMQIAQTSTLEVEGHVLWDEASGVMYEIVRTAAGTGTVDVPISPQPLPIALTTAQRARMTGG